jgi:DNA-binding transcriptional regulator of glucitol operon
VAGQRRGGFAGADGERISRGYARRVRRLLTRHWLGLHALVLVAVVAFLALGWWQAVRAGEGNARSYGYAAEWPTFAVILLFLWVRAMRAELRGPVVRPEDLTSTGPQVDERRLLADDAITAAEADDPDLAAYNRYLAGLADRHAQRQS